MRGARPEAAIEAAIASGGALVRNDRVVVACSGGADSVALAAAIADAVPTMNLTPYLAFIHHGTRDSAWQDECVVLRLGASLGVPVRIAALTGMSGDEATLRDARYAALAGIAQECGANVVATAHHREDQCETVLLALFRGTGPRGIGGMRLRRPLTDDVELVRPLLGVSADALRQYCHTRALPYAVDPTNGDPDIRRNAIRGALEGLRPLFPGLDSAVTRTATILAEEHAQSERALYRKQVRRVLEEQADLRDIDFSHVEAAARTLERGGSGRFHMKPGIELRIERGTIVALERAP